MQRIYVSFLSLLFSGLLHAQIVVTNPALPTDDQPVTVTFDASLGDQGLLNFTGDVYAHTGVITDKSTGSGDWKYVKADWTVNRADCKLTRISTNKYQLSISPSIRQFYGVPAGEKILKMAFVFRNSDGTKQGKDAGHADIFANVYAGTLNVSFSNPAGDFSLVDANQAIDVNVSATGNDSICLFLDNTKLFKADGQNLTFSLTATGTTRHTLVARAYKGTQTASDTVYYLVHATVQNAPVPVGLKDGINYIDNQTITFVLFAPYKNYIYLVGDFNNWVPDNNYLMKKDGDRYWITVNGLTPGKEYICQYFIDGNLRIADPYAEKISDPSNDQYISASIYPNLISYPAGKTSEIATVVQTAQTPYPWQVTGFVPPSKDKLVVYELLIRDFTANRDIKTITDTLSYLKRLGVNAIELMPFNEFEGNDSWGYNPSFYFAPDKAYGTKNDYKKFIDECHKIGIAVIQDMVLNHSYGSSPLVRMYFSNGNPSPQNPWYNVTSNILNPSLQFGYDFNHNSVYTQKLVDSVASFWMSEYKIDGFRYDFTKGFSNTPYPATSWASEYDTSRIRILKRMANAVWKRKSSAYVIFEHLSDNPEETELANAGILLWGNMNYNYTQASIGKSPDWDFSWISYRKRGWNDPNLMGYMESHDEERLMYNNLTNGLSSGSYNIKTLSTALKRIELAANFFITVPGPKMIWEFGETGYDISINENDRVGAKPVHWEYYNDVNRRHLYEVFRALISLKKENPVFSTSNFSIDAADPVKVMHLANDTSQIVIVGNFDVTDKSYPVTFPATGKWYEFYSGDSITITETTISLNLTAGEYRLYSNKKLKGSASIPTGIETIPQQANNVYPNPFTSGLYIANPSDITQIAIYDMTGQLVKQVVQKNTNYIDTGSLLPGIYLLVIRRNGNKEEKLKIVKAND